MSIKVENLKGVITRLEKIPAEMAQRIDEELTEGAETIEARAKMLAPVNDGLLRGSIVADTGVELHKEVTVSTFYAPYIEFGTGRKFKGNGRDQIAAQFKGKANRGNFNDMVNNLAEWIRKKGILTGGKMGRKRKDDKY
jgi:HK97 gp10 family phage protein